MIRALVFDFDGTLALSNSIKDEGFLTTAERFGVSGEIVREVLGRNEGLIRDQIFRKIVGEHLGQVGVLSHDAETLSQRMLSFFTEYCETKISSCPEVPGAMDALLWLSEKKLPLFVNSGTPQLTLRKIISNRGLDRFFKGVFGKPATKEENFQLVCESVGVSFSNLLHVGDSEEDRAAAERVGCAFIGVNTPPPRFYKKPSRLINDLRDFPNVFKSLVGDV